MTHHQLDELRISNLTAERDQLKAKLLEAERWRDAYVADNATLTQQRLSAEAERDQLRDALLKIKAKHEASDRGRHHEWLNELSEVINDAVYSPAILAERNRREKLDAVEKEARNVAEVFGEHSLFECVRRLRAALDGASAAQEQGK